MIKNFTIALFTLLFTQFSYCQECLIRNEPSFNDSGSCGTGFFIDKNKVLTAYHVIAGARNSRIEVNGRHVPLKVIKSDKHKDLALLEVEYDSDDFYYLNSGGVGVEEKVTARGYPAAVWTVHVSTGVVKEINNAIYPGSKSPIEVYSVWMDVIPGMSGGPLLTSENRVVGVLSTKNVGGIFRGNFISWKEIRDFLKKEK